MSTIKKVSETDKEMTGRERFSTGLGVVVGGVGLSIIYAEILSKMKIEKHRFMGITLLSIMVGGAVLGGISGHNIGKKWQLRVDKK